MDKSRGKRKRYKCFLF